MRYEQDEADLVERTSVQGSRSDNTAQSKTRKEPSQVRDDEETNGDTDPKWKSRSRRNPDSPQTQGPPSIHQVRISFLNETGIMINENIGNAYNLSTSG